MALSKHQQACWDDHMPEDVTNEILIRLPVKSLLRFKCVSKHWYHLIQNPNFALSHLRFQKLQNKSRIFLHHFNRDTNEDCYALFPDESLASVAYHRLDFLIDSRALIAGPVNGLFCLFNGEDRFILWNPAIREFRTLPFPLHPYFTLDLRAQCSSIGFGFDPSTDDYKVVLFRHFFDEIRGGMPLGVHIYSLSTNTWRYLDRLDYLSPQYLVPYSETGAYSYGVYYWWNRDVVVAFDMGTEVFRVISPPFTLGSLLDGRCNCGVTTYNDDSIALYQFTDVSGSEIDKWCDIWVMEAEGCWIKKFSVGPIPQIANLHGFWKNGVLLFRNTIPTSEDLISQLVLYNPCTRELRYLGPKATFVGYQGIVYHESLVSVYGGIHQRKGKLSDSVAAQYFCTVDPRFSFLEHLIRFMRDFRVMKKHNTQTLFTGVDHKKARRLLSKVWESCEYSRKVPVF